MSGHSFYTQPLVHYGPSSSWTFHGPAGTCRMYQLGPGIYPPEDIVRYLVDCAAAAGDPDRLVLSPPGDPRRRGTVGGRTAAAGSAIPVRTALVAWLFWSDLLLPEEYQAYARRARIPVRHKGGGFSWTVWENPDGTLDAAFVAVDHQGEENPAFTYPRGPIAGLPDRLAVTSKLADLVDNF